MRQQDYDGDLECILVDDCTPDNSMIIAKSLIDSYHGPINFRILRNPENQGLSCSRNNGMSIAKGDYVFFLDSDDYISNDCICFLSKQLYLCDLVVDIVVGNSFEYQNKKYWQEIGSDSVVLGDHVAIMRKFLQRQIPMMAWNKLVRRQLLQSFNILFTPKLVHEDELWSFQLYDVVNCVVLISNVTYYYEQNADSIMNSSAYLKYRAKSCYTLVYKMLEALDKKDLYVDKFFWGIYMYMVAEDLIYKSHSEFVDRNNKLCWLMLSKTLKDGRWSISVFLLFTIIPPFSYLVRFSWFRHKYYIMRSIFKKLALFFDFIHHCKV